MSLTTITETHALVRRSAFERGYQDFEHCRHACPFPVTFFEAVRAWYQGQGSASASLAVPFAAGSPCVIVGVNHKLMASDLGRRVVIMSLQGGGAFVSLDQAPTYGKNRRGRTVLKHDPRCIQTAKELTQLRHATPAELAAQPPAYGAGDRW